MVEKGGTGGGNGELECLAVVVVLMVDEVDWVVDNWL